MDADVEILETLSFMVKTLYFRLQHTGHPDQMFVILIHLYEIGLALMVLLKLQFRELDRSNESDTMSWRDILGNWLDPMAKLRVQFCLFTLATGGYGMGVLLSSNRPVHFYLAGLAVFIISISLKMVQAYLWSGVRHADFDARVSMICCSLVVYMLVLLVATYVL
uniref:Uncharacterized protein n=1 Tax=Leersia perrieri TaxID=77586 RepID=A0A0D9X2W8_9ORYZ